MDVDNGGLDLILLGGADQRHVLLKFNGQNLACWADHHSIVSPSGLPSKTGK